MDYRYPGRDEIHLHSNYPPQKLLHTYASELAEEYAIDGKAQSNRALPTRSIHRNNPLSQLEF